MSGKTSKALRRQVRRNIYADIKEVCDAYWESLLELPLWRRIGKAARIVWGKRKKRQQ